MHQPAFRRDRLRDGPVRLNTKLRQGLGALPGGHKEWAFNTVLLLYYSQVLGMPASSASVVLGVALLVDAVTDPLLGAWSDNFRSRWGRRHPFMFASVLPVMAFMYWLFAPPQGESAAFLTGWMLVFTLLARSSFTLFAVPWNAITAELSLDYVERTSIITYRFLIGWTGGIVFVFSMFTFVFPASAEFDAGQMNPANYPRFALIVSCLMGLWMFSTSALTLREVPYLPQLVGSVSGGENAGLRQLVGQIGLALDNRNFRILFAATLIAAAIGGTGQVFDVYMNLYFWEFKSGDLRWFSLVVIGALLSFLVVPGLQARFQKHHILLATITLVMMLAMAKVLLRFADIWPDNGDPLLLPLLVMHLTVVVFVLNISAIMFASMVPDLVDEQEFFTGVRQEGVFSSSITFAAKATSSLGLIVGGVLLDWVIRFPLDSQPGEVAGDVLFRLAVIDGIAVNLVFLIPFALLFRYSLTRDKLESIQDQLKSSAVSASGSHEP